mgnify:CR=1 FL=1
MCIRDRPAPASKWRGTKCNNLGDMQTQEISLIDDHDASKGLRLVYRDGDICKKQVSGQMEIGSREVIYEVECDRGADPGVLQKIVEIADTKATITPEDLPFIIADILESGDYQQVELLNCSITSGLDIESTASIRVRVGEEFHKSSDSGNGGFDAFIKAFDGLAANDAQGAVRDLSTLSLPHPCYEHHWARLDSRLKEPFFLVEKLFQNPAHIKYTHPDIMQEIYSTVLPRFFFTLSFGSEFYK